MGKGDATNRNDETGFAGDRPPAGDARRGEAYRVDLLYPGRPALDTDALAARVRGYCPHADVAAAAGGRPPVLVSHKDHLVPIDPRTDREPDAFGGEAGPAAAVPARTVVMPTDGVVDVAALHAALGQTRDWDAAVEALARSTVRVVVTDLLAGDLEPRDRLALFEAVLLGVIEATRPAAIHWRPAGKLVDPAALLRASGSAEVDALPAAAINVRMYRVKQADRTRLPDQPLLMDTLGLAALGLPDLQVAFHGMDPARVAAHLYAVALYTLRHGGVVGDGDAIEGPGRGQEWVGRRGRSAVEPARPVVDFHPGDEYAIRAN
jgi:hypothetical protein